MLLTEVDQLLAGGSVGSLLEVRVEARPEGVRPLGNAIALIRGHGSVGGVVLLVEAGQSVHEPGGDAVCVVKLDRSLDRSITDNVAMGEVLGNDSGAGLLLLRDLVGIPVSISGGVLSILRGRSAGRLDGDVV